MTGHYEMNENYIRILHLMTIIIRRNDNFYLKRT